VSTSEQLRKRRGAQRRGTTWSLNGPTDIDNLVSLCSYHHHLVHDEHFTLSKATDNEWNLDPP